MFQTYLETQQLLIYPPLKFKQIAGFAPFYFDFISLVNTFIIIIIITLLEMELPRMECSGMISAHSN